MMVSLLEVSPWIYGAFSNWAYRGSDKQNNKKQVLLVVFFCIRNAPEN